MGTQIILIWSQDRDGVIGINGALPWNLPEDLYRFRDFTWGFPVVMGFTTYNSLPIRPLPGRKNIVLTTQKNQYDAGTDSVIYVSSMDEAIIQADDSPWTWVIGGSVVFSQLLSLADRIEVTEVDALIQGTVDDHIVRAPKIPHSFICTKQSPWMRSQSQLKYRYCSYSKNRAG